MCGYEYVMDEIVRVLNLNEWRLFKRKNAGIKRKALSRN